MKNILVFIAITLLSVTASAQLPQGFERFKRAAKAESLTPEQNLVSKIARDGAFILSQSYQLEDSVGKFFGLSGNKEFGSANTIAFKIKNGYMFYDLAKAPWNYNPKYSKIRKRYNPVLFPSQYSELNAEARYDSIPYIESEVKTIYPEQLYGMQSDIFFNDGFSVAHNCGSSEGFLIWYVLPDQLDLTISTDIETYPIPFQLNIKENRGLEYDVPQLRTNGTVLGGLFIVPEITGVGHLSFIINGVIIESQDEWKLICPFINGDSLFTSENTAAVPIDDDTDVELTPNESK